MHKFFASHKHPISLVLLLIIAGGLVVYGKMQSSLFPEITFPKIKIIADGGLQPVDKMMVNVTRPLENAIKQIPDLTLIRSTTSRGSCEISAYLDWSANVDICQQRIESKIGEMRNVLPAEVNINIEKMNPSILPVMGYTLESHNKSPIELNQLAVYTIKPFLSQVDGVAEVRIIGGKTKEYWLQLNMQKMSSLSVTPDAISSALNATNFIKSNGYLSDYRFLYLTVTDASVHSKNDLENIVISNSGKRILFLKDVADIEIKEAVEYTKINANGHDGVLVAIIKQPNANLLSLSNKMDTKVVELQSFLPKGVTIQPYYKQADFVKDSIRSVTDSLVIGLLLAIIVAILFLRSFKASMTLLIIIPCTLGLTLIILYAIGYTFNIMTLGALAAAIGLIIDDAIVVVEQIHRTHEEHPEETYSTIVSKAIHFLYHAMIGSSISTIVIFIPFFLMSGVAGAYFKVLTNTMIITLVCSFFVTWIGLPVIYLLLSRFKRKPPKVLSIKERFQRRKRNKFQTETVQKTVAFFIRKPIISFTFISILILSIVLILPKLKTGFLPSMDEGSIVMDYSSPAGTSLEETDRILRQVEKNIVANPEVEAYSRRTGTQMGFFITEPNTGDYLIQLKKNHTKTTDEVSNELREKIASTQPALRVEFGQVIGDMLGDLTSSVEPVEIKIFGNDPVVLKNLSVKISETIKQVKGTADVFDGIVIAGPSISIEPDFVKLAQFGITASNLQYQIQNSLEGNIVGNVFEEEQVNKIRLIYPGSRRTSVSDLGQLQIFLPNGKLEPITELANIKVHAGDAEIHRQNLQSIGVITARLDNRDLGSAMKDIKNVIKSKVNMPQGYHVEYGGAYADQQQSFKELLMILVLASTFVFCVILFVFKKFKIALTILVIAVLGVSGSYMALYFTNTPLNVGSYTGLIMIVGIIGENAIFTIVQFKESLLTKGVDDSIIYAISTRLRPKLMTALGAIIALSPLALGIGAGAQLHQPLAIAVIGGFIIALPLLLVVLPSALRLLYRNNQTEKKPAV